MTVTVSMPQLGESVTEGTVTRWLKKEGERVEADEPLLEVSTDKVDTEIPSPASGILRGITVAEDETVAVGAQLAIIDDAEDGAGAVPGGQARAAGPAAPQAVPEPASYPYAVPEPAPPEYAPPAPAYQVPAAPAEPQYRPAVPEYSSPYSAVPEAGYAPAAAPGYAAPPAEAYPPQQAYAPPAAAPAPPAQQQVPVQPPPAPAPQAVPAPAPEPAAAAPPPAPAPAAPAPQAAPAAAPDAQPATAEGPYITPLVRKLAAEHGVDLAEVTGTGVGGRIRKQDVLEAARVLREQQTAAAPAAPQPAAAGGQPAAAPAAATAARAIVPSTLRGTTERLSRARQLIARRMVESLQTSAQLTTVVEADVTAITRLRARAKADFEGREGVRLTYLPFFALATLEALKVHPKLNAVLNTEAGQIIYHDAEHLGIAVDTERGLMVPVIRNAGDLNIGGLARKIADLAGRTRAGQVSPDELAGGTFTLTNTGSRGALFDTPIINQPQVAILGTGTVVKRAVVMEDPALGEVITVRSMVYLALTYDHRLIDGADAARFLTTVKERLEEGAFESELGL
ncbi:MAG TPA: 2-oxoglutarate dehydrogenase, E2 component, dihydrolipoamide succinyltransferase [Streptosporangiaceae bacterium]|nr:2-oxoglutarate dehydrogenase, E2 component, dihydrolipoamide succinyltransferase [Streptosporangiaceae bacterium]